MARLGRQADLAAELGISRSAISQAFKKFDIQIAVGGLFDLDHATWLLEKKQCQAKSKGQRAAKKPPSGLKNPKVKREIARLLWPVWDEAITATIAARVETSFVDASDFRDVENYMLACMLLWTTFHRILDRQIPKDLGDFEFRKPDCIDFDIMQIAPLDQINKILNGEPLAQTSPPSTPPLAPDGFEND